MAKFKIMNKVKCEGLGFPQSPTKYSLETLECKLESVTIQMVMVTAKQAPNFTTVTVIILCKYLIMVI